MNPLEQGSDTTFSEGNLKAVSTNSGGWESHCSTLNASTGKWYFETECVAGSRFSIGIADASDNIRDLYTTDLSPAYAYNYNGKKYSGGTTDGGVVAATFTASDIIGCAFDLDAGTIRFYKNGIDQGVFFSDVESGVAYKMAASTRAATVVANFGQKPFKYAPPDGFQPLNAANVRPETVIVRPDQYVGVTTYTGNGSVQSINVGLKPDFVWIKNRDTTDSHVLFDTIRGVERTLYSNLTNNDSYNAGSLTSFDSDGFTLGSYANANQNTSGLVAWAWKAGGNKNTFNVDDVGYASAAAAGLTGGSITPTGSSVGTKQGFSILKWTGVVWNGSNPQSISHGLSQAPQFMILKNLERAVDWAVYHEAIGNTTMLELNQSGAKESADSGFWNNTSPTNSVFTVGNGHGYRTGGIDEDYIGYIWHDVPGLQKFGSYVGNGNNDGVYIELGFAPKVLLTKSSSHGSDWQLWDTSRQPYNVNANTLTPNSSAAETGTAGYAVDMLSNGVKFRMYGSSSNQSGYTYIYAAWAEVPTFNLYGAQSNTR